MGPEAGALELGVAETALKRIEEGAVQRLLNIDPAKVAAYLSRIAADPTVVVRAACKTTEQYAWGYTPGDHGETRPQTGISAASDALDPRDRLWIEAFLISWSGKVNGAASTT